MALRIERCSEPGCAAVTITCPETDGDSAPQLSAQTYCLRAQGWLRARNSKYYYCPQHRWELPAASEERTHSACWRRHRGESTLAATTASASAGPWQRTPPPPPPPAAATGFDAQLPPPQPPSTAAATTASVSAGPWQRKRSRPPPSVAPPPPFQPLADPPQCESEKCRMGLVTCGVCSRRLIAWTDDHALMTPLAQKVLELANCLNCLPSYWLPECIVDPGSELQGAARYSPDDGHGDEREADVGNRAGSALLLAVLLPHVFGIPGAGPLRVCGWPPPVSLTNISNRPRPRSGQGPDNRRMNVWEALLNYWQSYPVMQDHRDLLLDVLVRFRVAVDVVDREWELPVWMLPRDALQARDISLPLGRRPRGSNGDMV